MGVLDEGNPAGGGADVHWGLAWGPEEDVVGEAVLLIQDQGELDPDHGAQRLVEGQCLTDVEPAHLLLDDP